MIPSIASSLSYKWVASIALLAIGGCNLYSSDLLAPREGLGGGSAAGLDQAPSAAGASSSGGSEPQLSSAGAGGAGSEAGEPALSNGGAPSSAGSGAGGDPDGNQAAGAGGANGSDGEAGAAGSSAVGATELPIDDLEDGNLAITGPGYSGYWYLFADQTAGGSCTPNPLATSLLEPANPLNPSSALGLALAGKFAGWGIGLGFALEAPGEVPFDASAFTGIAFSARLGASAHPVLVITVGDSRCNGCGNEAEVALTLSQEWRRYYLPFDSFHQPGTATFDTPDPTELGPVQFMVGGGRQLDVWLDDVALYTE